MSKDIDHRVTCRCCVCDGARTSADQHITPVVLVCECRCGTIALRTGIEQSDDDVGGSIDTDVASVGLHLRAIGHGNGASGRNQVYRACCGENVPTAHTNTRNLQTQVTLRHDADIARTGINSRIHQDVSASVGACCQKYVAAGGRDPVAVAVAVIERQIGGCTQNDGAGSGGDVALGTGYFSQARSAIYLSYRGRKLPGRHAGGVVHEDAASRAVCA